MNSEYMPASKAAKIIGHTARWLKKKADAGEIPVYNHGTKRKPLHFYKKSDIEKLLADLKISEKL